MSGLIQLPDIVVKAVVCSLVAQFSSGLDARAKLGPIITRGAKCASCGYRPGCNQSISIYLFKVLHTYVPILFPPFCSYHEELPVIFSLFGNNLWNFVESLVESCEIIYGIYMCYYSYS